MLKNKTCENGFHNPSKYENPMIRFFHFLFYKNKLFYPDDDTALCAQCNCFVRTPLAYYQQGIKVVYMLIGILSVTLLCWVPSIGPGTFFLQVGITVSLNLGLTHTTDALVLSLFPWRVFDETKIESQMYRDRAESERNSRSNMTVIGVIIGTVIVLVL